MQVPTIRFHKSTNQYYVWDATAKQRSLSWFRWRAGGQTLSTPCPLHSFLNCGNISRAGSEASQFGAASGWRRIARMIRFDLAAAGVEYKVDGPNGPEYADFHALRHSFVTALAAAGVNSAELQKLARHSDPRLTLNIYTHVSDQQLGGP